MKLKVFAIYDSKVKAYVQPFYMVHEGEAVRGFEQVTNDKNTKINMYPEDYTLFMLGEFNDENGKFENYTAPQMLISAMQVHKKTQNIEEIERGKENEKRAERKSKRKQVNRMGKKAKTNKSNK